MPGKKSHLTILALLIVLVPPWFLVFTDEGARISDNVVLWLWGETGLDLNFSRLDAGIDQQQIPRVYPDLDWQCEDRRTDFGDRLCAATIASVNQYPARYVSFFFGDGRLRAMKLVYRSRYHDALLAQLRQQLGTPATDAMPASDRPDHATLLEWNTGSGRLIAKRHLHEDDEPALMWIAARDPAH